MAIEREGPTECDSYTHVYNDVDILQQGKWGSGKPSARRPPQAHLTPGRLEGLGAPLAAMGQTYTLMCPPNEDPETLAAAAQTPGRTD